VRIVLKVPAPPAKFNQTELRFYRGLIFCLLILITSGALSIPFIYESQTLWYKVGIDRTMLRGGQMAGLLAAILLFVQILLAARGAFLKELFGTAALLQWHRINGLVVSFIALCHMFLVLAPEGLTNLPIGMRYWPEMVGGFLLAIILLTVGFAQLRKILGLDYKRWRIFHKLMGYPSIIFLAIHVSNVSDSFEQVIPRAAFFAILLAVVVSVFLSKRIHK